MEAGSSQLSFQNCRESLGIRMSTCGRNSKGIEPAIGQNDSNDEIIIKVEPLGKVS